ncbi:PREDICTED: C-type lectin domain family 17, member A-like isoform X1 [Thamnophis sirtalis]|uniref:C-type lectin domain family 17, member A-like isoform X1 n=1 Tax=Thamnophis sirtalis TaxID=35019 RepID=A0A6I9XHM5_9SAUR|nr:PREDICTED: C-type lectin domain family 17, member A-like isoform X1 [Thamnophis sirtalis]
MEEELQTPRRRDHTVWFRNWKHILLWVTMGIAFVLLLALSFQSLRNDSEVSKDINKQNRELSLLCNNSGKLDEFKTEIANDIRQVCGSVSTFKADLAKNCSMSPVLETLEELKRDNARIAEDVMQILDAVRNFTEVHCTTCPAHWLPYQNSCYLFSFAKNPWKIAQQSCENEDSHLVILNSGLEQNFLVKHMGHEQVFWIGLSDAHKENQWIWVDNTTLSLSFWGNGEPNNAGSNEDCATLRVTGKWNDVACSGNQYWICEKKC